jgi:hypothetical protein
MTNKMTDKKAGTLASKMAGTLASKMAGITTRIRATFNMLLSTND